MAVLASVGEAHGQVRLGVAGGPAHALGDFGDALDAGFHGGIVADFGLPLIPLSLHGDLMYQRNAAASPQVDDYSHVAATANARLDLIPLPLVSAFVTGGVGLYASDYPDDALDASSGWSTEPGINVGVGAALSLLFLHPFVELRYHRVLSDPARSFVPLTIGLMLF